MTSTPACACHLTRQCRTCADRLYMSTVDYLGLAYDTGLSLLGDAKWSGESCTWITTIADRFAGREPRSVECDGGLYQGTAGIGLFLAELWSHCGDNDLLPAIRGAALYAKQSSQR